MIEAFAWHALRGSARQQARDTSRNGQELAVGSRGFSLLRELDKAARQKRKAQELMKASEMNYATTD